MTALTVAQLARLCGAALEGDPTVTVTGPAPIAEARPDQVTFVTNARFALDLEHTRAGAVVLPRELDTKRRDLVLLRTDEPSRAFSRVIEAFRPMDELPVTGIHASAVVDPSARIAASASIGPCATIGPEAEIGENASIGPGVVVGARCTIGVASALSAHVVLYPRTRIGQRCLVHAGTVIGADGFGFEPGPQGWEKIPQCGWVEIGDDVEIGANCTIDRGRFGATRLGAGVKLDNLVHVAHNVLLGEGALLVAQVGVAGSARIGRGVVLAGQVGVANHMNVGDGARVGGQSAVFNDLAGGREYFGSPAVDKAEALRALAVHRRLPEMAVRLRKLEQRVRDLERGEG
jgi:UDP-3-O-[3-hydroxymyristoyl] glucosamine N-acyltransferase